MSSCSVARLLAVAFAVSWLNVTLSSSSPSPLDKCVNIRLDDSQRIYLTGSGQKGSVGPRGLPGKIGPKGEKGEQGLRGIVGLRGVKGSKGDDSGITDLENRLAAAERLITELMEFRQNITETAGCLLTTFSSCKAALTTGCSNDGIYYLQPPGVQTRFTVRQTEIYSTIYFSNKDSVYLSIHRSTHSSIHLPILQTIFYTCIPTYNLIYSHADRPRSDKSDLIQT